MWEDFQSQSRHIRSAQMQPQIEGWHVRMCRAAFCRQIQLNPTYQFPASSLLHSFCTDIFSRICFEEGKGFLLLLFLLLVVV
jgi:hypothetical protein